MGAALLLCLPLQACGTDGETGGSGEEPSQPVSRDEKRPSSDAAKGGRPPKLTKSLREVASDPTSMEDFKKFIAKFGTPVQKREVRHLKQWRGVKQKVYLALEVTSDYPTVDNQAIDAGDDDELERSLALNAKTFVLAEAVDLWWDNRGEKTVLQVSDRAGEPVGTSCITATSIEDNGSCA